MSEANKIQVGGSHYKADGGQEHWDRIVQLFGWPGARAYFVGCITKYVERYWKKNGTQDLKKAIHYLQKLVEIEENPPVKPDPEPLPPGTVTVPYTSELTWKDINENIERERAKRLADVPKPCEHEYELFKSIATGDLFEFCTKCGHKRFNGSAK